MPLPKMPDYSFKNEVPLSQVMDMIVNKRLREEQLNKMAVDRGQSMVDSIVKTTDMASQTVQNMVAASRHRQLVDQISQGSKVMDNISAIPNDNAGTPQTFTHGGASTPIGQVGTPQSNQIKMADTPEYKSTLMSRVANMYPEIYAKAYLDQAIPKPANSLEALAARAIAGNQPIDPAITQTKRDMQAPKPRGRGNYLVDGQPDVVVFDTNGNPFSSTTGQSLMGHELKPIPNEINRDLRVETKKSDLVTKFNTDSSVKKSQQAKDFAGDVTTLAQSGNPIAAAAIPTYMARASGEVGNLSEADKRPFGGSRAILTRLEAALQQMATGQLTDDNQKFVVQLSSIMSKRADEKIDQLAKLRAKQYSHGSSIFNEKDLYESFRPQMDAPAGSPTNKKATMRWNPESGTLEPL